MWRSCSVQTLRFADSERDRALDDEQQLNTGIGALLSRSWAGSAVPAELSVRARARAGRDIRTCVAQRHVPDSNVVFGMRLRRLGQPHRADAIHSWAVAEVALFVAAPRVVRTPRTQGRGDWAGVLNAPSGGVAVRSRVDEGGAPWQA